MKTRQLLSMHEDEWTLNLVCQVDGWMLANTQLLLRKCGTYHVYLLVLIELALLENV